MEIRQKVTEKEKKETRTLYGLKEHYNPMFNLKVDLFRQATCNYNYLVNNYVLKSEFTNEMCLFLL